MSGDSDIAQTFGKRVRRLREAKHWTQERLAAETDLHRSYIAGIESGRRNPVLRNIAKIADALGVPITTLFECNRGRHLRTHITVRLPIHRTRPHRRYKDSDLVGRTRAIQY